MYPVIYKIKKDKLPSLLDYWAKDYDVFAPIEKRGKFKYDKINKATEAELDPPVALLGSFKFLFMPLVSEVGKFSITKSGVDFSSDNNGETKSKQVVFGAKPCEVAALERLDKISSWDYKDEDYFERRERTTIVSLLCTQPDNYCFCTTLGFDWQKQEGSDIMVLYKDDNAYLRINTDKGNALIDLISDKSILFKAEVDELDPLYDEFKDRVKPKFDADQVLPFLSTKEAFDSPVFDKYGSYCLGCRVCASVCPTCYCFKISDEIYHDSGIRYKNYDSCNTRYFTLMAGGHNPRPTTNKRWRQRAMHKFVYFKERFGLTLCVGCGNCARNCPIHINIADVISDVATNTRKEVSK
jgi:ferredoxin